MRAGRFRGEKKVKNGFYLQRVVNNCAERVLRGLRAPIRADGLCAGGGKERRNRETAARIAYGLRMRQRPRCQRGEPQPVLPTACAQGGKGIGLRQRMARGGLASGKQKVRRGLLWPARAIAYFGKRGFYQAKRVLGP